MQFVLVLGVMQIMIKGFLRFLTFSVISMTAFDPTFLLLFHVALPIKGTEGVR